jgi:hypothetical protein
MHQLDYDSHPVDQLFDRDYNMSFYFFVRDVKVPGTGTPLIFVLLSIHSVDGLKPSDAQGVGEWVITPPPAVF